MSEVKAQKFPQYLASTSAALGAFQLGLLLSNVVQLEIESGDYGFPTSKEEFSWISSAFVLGAMFACIPTGYLINGIGRKWTMIVMCAPFFCGWLLILFAQSTIWMYFGRFMLGLAGGSYCVSVPVYVGEIAQKEIRGLLGTIFQFMIVTGICAIYTMGAFLTTFTVSLVCSVFPIVLAILMFFMPESPVYLIKKDKAEAANKSFAWLRGKDYDVNFEIEDIRSADAKDKANPIPVGKAIKRPETIRAFVISSMLMVLQQFCGVNVVIFYSTDIFRDAGTGFSPRIATLLLGFSKVFITFVALILMDILGRRALLLLSGISLVVCNCALGIYFFLKVSDPELADSLAWLPFTSICAFVVLFSIGYGPIPWLMLGEMFSTDIKGLAGSVSATLNWLCAFVVTKTFVNLKGLLGAGGTFMLFMVITAFGIVFIYFVVIETKGKSLNEIQAELISKTKRNDNPQD